MDDREMTLAMRLDTLSPMDVLNETDTKILKAYALHPKASIEVLRVLASHDDRGVRAAVAENSTTPSEVLDHLASDSYCVENVAKNRNASPSTLARIITAHNDNRDQPYLNAIANPNTSLDVLLECFMSTVPKAASVALRSNPTFMGFWAKSRLERMNITDEFDIDQ